MTGWLIEFDAGENRRGHTIALVYAPDYAEACKILEEQYINAHSFRSMTHFYSIPQKGSGAVAQPG